MSSSADEFGYKSLPRNRERNEFRRGTWHWWIDFSCGLNNKGVVAVVVDEDVAGVLFV